MAKLIYNLGDGYRLEYIEGKSYDNWCLFKKTYQIKSKDCLQDVIESYIECLLYKSKNYSDIQESLLFANSGLNVIIKQIKNNVEHGYKFNKIDLIFFQQESVVVIDE